MKICSSCQQEKPFEQFNKSSRNQDGLQPYCRDCQKTTKRAWLDVNRNKVNLSQNDRRIRNAVAVWEYLLLRPCIDCGENDPVVLEFDHRDPSLKTAAVSTMMNFSLKHIFQEIDKCDVRCANCHRRKTASDLGWIRSTKYGPIVYR